MRRIDIQTWPRREHFNVFSAWDHPHFNMCANVDLTVFYPALKQRGISFTVAVVFCTIDYDENFPAFAAGAAERIAYVKELPSLEGDPARDDLLFMTAIPWVSLTSFKHPMHLQPADSILRLAWGKYFEEGKFLKMPLSVQGHHALMDGIHMGKFHAEVQDYLNQPDFVLGEA